MEDWLAGWSVSREASAITHRRATLAASSNGLIADRFRKVTGGDSSHQGQCLFQARYFVGWVESARPTASRCGERWAFLPVPPAANQDAFAANDASGQTRWQYRRNQHRLVERMLERYASHSPEPSAARRVHLVPTHVGLDGVHKSVPRTEDGHQARPPIQRRPSVHLGRPPVSATHSSHG